MTSQSTARDRAVLMIAKVMARQKDSRASWDNWGDRSQAAFLASAEAIMDGLEQDGWVYG